MLIPKPAPGEYNPFIERYLRLTKEGSFPETLNENTDRIVQFFQSIPSAKHEYAYATGKWTIRQMLLHMTDTERVLQYRALVIARGDKDLILPPFDEEAFASEMFLENQRSLNDLIEEFQTVRKSTEYLFQSITPAQLTYRGNAGGFSTTPRAIAYFILGHPLHHINIVNERYL